MAGEAATCARVAPRTYLRPASRMAARPCMHLMMAATRRTGDHCDNGATSWVLGEPTSDAPVTCRAKGRVRVGPVRKRDARRHKDFPDYALASVTKRLVAASEFHLFS